MAADSPVVKTSVVDDPDRPRCILVTVSGQVEDVIGELARIAGRLSQLPRDEAGTRLDRMVAGSAAGPHGDC